MAKSPKTFTSHSPPRARTLSGPATRRRWTRELPQSRNRAFGPNGMPTTSRQTSATRTDTTSRLPINPGSTNKMYEPSTHNAEGEHAARKRCVMSINKNNPLADNAPTDHEDQALVMRTRSGDREALERLI